LKHSELKLQKGNERLADRAYRRLEELIVTLQIEPGSVVSENMLGDELGLGRTPVREALLRLAHDGILTILDRRGIYVAAIDVKAQFKMLEVRKELERLAARLAAKRASKEQRQQLIELADQMIDAAEAADDKEFLKLDRLFNDLTADLCQNEFIRKSLSPMYTLSRRFWFYHYQRDGDLGQTARLHADVARSIGHADEEKAAEASDSLMDYIRELTRATIDM